MSPLSFLLLGIWLGIGLIIGLLFFVIVEANRGPGGLAFLCGILWPLYPLLLVYQHFFPPRDSTISVAKDKIGHAFETEDDSTRCRHCGLSGWSHPRQDPR